MVIMENYISRKEIFQSKGQAFSEHPPLSSGQYCLFSCICDTFFKFQDLHNFRALLSFPTSIFLTAPTGAEHAPRNVHFLLFVVTLHTFSKFM